MDKELERFKAKPIDNTVEFLFLDGIMPGTIHQCQGQEATAVGVCANLRPNDFITSTFRAHGHALAKGLTVEELLNELFGAATGCCKGRGGSMHVGNMAKGMIPAIAIVGGGIPVAMDSKGDYHGVEAVIEIYWVDFSPGKGSEPKGRRPGLVIQNNILNESKLNTVLMVAITSTMKFGELPGNVVLRKGEASLSKKCVINVTQIKSVDKESLKEMIGSLSKKRMDQVYEGIKLVMGIS